MHDIQIRYKITDNWTKPSDNYPFPKQLRIDVGEHKTLFREHKAWHITKPQRLIFSPTARTWESNVDRETRGDGVWDWNKFQRDEPTIFQPQISWPYTTSGWITTTVKIHHGLGAWMLDFLKSDDPRAIPDNWLHSSHMYRDSNTATDFRVYVDEAAE